MVLTGIDGSGGCLSIMAMMPTDNAVRIPKKITSVKDMRKNWKCRTPNQRPVE